MDKFIYVFDTAARDELLQAGFLLLKEDEPNSMYIFSADEHLHFTLDEMELSYVLTDTLTF